MAPSRKKKKPASNPARGFATVSLPSRAKEKLEGSVEKTKDGELTESRLKSSGGASPSKLASVNLSRASQMMTAEELEAHFEDAELQMLVEAHAARCKQDAARQVTKLEIERRQLRSQANKLSTVTWLSEDTTDTILERSVERRALSIVDSQRDSSEDADLLSRLWTLQIVLETLGFPDTEDALIQLLLKGVRAKVQASSEYIWGLPQIFHWYSISRSQGDLPDYETKSSSSCPVQVTNTADCIPSDTDVHTEQSRSQKGVSQPDQDTPGNRSNEELEGDVELPPMLSTDSEADDPAMLIDKYLQLQRQLFDIETRINETNYSQPHPKFMQRRSRLQERVAKLRRDILFDVEMAEAVWQQKHQELTIERSRSIKLENLATNKLPQESPNLNEKGMEDIDEEGILGSMFEDDEDGVPTAEQLSTNTSVYVVEFGKYSGISPRRLLEENICSQNDHKLCRFTILSTSPHAVRQKLEIHWTSHRNVDKNIVASLPAGMICDSTPRMFVISMAAIATTTAMEAESYLATAALYLLIQSGHIDHKQSLRLPTVWRDVYTDLCQARQLLIVAADKEKLRGLRRIIRVAQEQIKQQTNDSVINRRSAAMTGVDIVSRIHSERAIISPTEARAQWQSIVTSPRYKALLNCRQQLPVHMHRTEILQEIERSQLVIICADTGAGKSTQVPAFVLESQLSNGLDSRILVTQPRRISAISLARRVSQELGEHKNDLGTERSLVGYAIRLESRTSRTTRITFATTGVLLRMIEASPDLDDLDFLILDEVHERSMDIDLLFVALKMLQKRRANLKIILMSATVDAQKFSQYFADAPILNVPGRTYPVDIKFLEDAVEDTLDIEISKHNNGRSPHEEVDSDNEQTNVKSEAPTLDGYSMKTLSKLAEIDEYRINYELVASLAEAIATKEKYVRYSSAILIFMPGIAEIRRLHNVLLNRSSFRSNWVVHLLHSSFSTEDLEKAFAIPPAGWRKIVIATNIAETGITIPDVTAVIDTCKEKVMRFDERRQLSKLSEGFIARSSARQRRGRAARVQEGLCFHLVTRYRFENLMLEQHVPEMLRLSLQDPILRVKVWNLGSIESTLSAAIDPPSAKNIRRAVEKLKDAGALSNDEELTQLGRKIARLPLDVILGKLAIFGIVFRCLDSILTIVASLSSKPPFSGDKIGHDTDPRLMFARADSDLISTLSAYQGWRKARLAGQSYQFCKKHHLSEPNLWSIEDQKIQLLVYLVDAGFLQLDLQEKAHLNQARATGNRKLAFTLPDRFNMYDSDGILNCTIAMAFYPKILTQEGKGWRNVYTNQRVNLASNSVQRATEKPPRWLCFYEATQIRSGALNVLETSKISEIIIVTLLGSADMKFFSGVIALDHGKMRFSVQQWRKMAALKALRKALAGVLQRCWQTPRLEMSPSDQQWIELLASIVDSKTTKSQ